MGPEEGCEAQYLHDFLGKCGIEGKRKGRVNELVVESEKI